MKRPRQLSEDSQRGIKLLPVALDEEPAQLPAGKEDETRKPEGEDTQDDVKHHQSSRGFISVPMSPLTSLPRLYATAKTPTAASGVETQAGLPPTAKAPLIRSTPIARKATTLAASGHLRQARLTQRAGSTTRQMSRPFARKKTVSRTMYSPRKKVPSPLRTSIGFLPCRSTKL